METSKLHHMIKVTISGQQHGFMPGRSTDDDVCFENVDRKMCRRSDGYTVSLWIYKKHKREEEWHFMRKSGITDKYVRL